MEAGFAIMAWCSPQKGVKMGERCQYSSSLPFMSHAKQAGGIKTWPHLSLASEDSGAFIKFKVTATCERNTKLGKN
jgi:hypothetical protein